MKKELYVSCMKELVALQNRLDRCFDVLGISDAFDSDLFEHIWKLQDTLSEEIGDYDEPKAGRLISDFIINTDCGKKYDTDEYLIEINGVKYKPTSFEEFYDMCQVMNEDKDK